QDGPLPLGLRRPPGRAHPGGQRGHRDVNRLPELVAVVQDTGEVRQRLEGQRPAALPPGRPPPDIGVVQVAPRPLRIPLPPDPRPRPGPPDPPASAPARRRRPQASACLGPTTIEEAPTSAHPSTRRRSRPVLPEPEPANTATCLRSDSNVSQSGSPSTAPKLI